MADDTRPGTTARLTGFALIVALAAFYVALGHEWYFGGKMLLCTPEEITKPASWCHKPDPPREAIANPNDLFPAFGRYNDTYEGLGKFWGDDVVSNLFSQIGSILERWFAELMNGWFWPVFAPQWNAFFSTDDPTANGHRLAFGLIVGVFYGALVSKVIGSLVDWAHGK